MPTRPDKPTRWRPRFSVRTLVVIVTVVCAYAACWGPTKERGRDDVEMRVKPIDVGEGLGLHTVFSIAPLLVAVEDTGSERTCRRYYFWFFGYVAKLPYEREDSLEEFRQFLRDNNASH